MLMGISKGRSVVFVRYGPVWSESVDLMSKEDEGGSLFGAAPPEVGAGTGSA